VHVPEAQTQMIEPELHSRSRLAGYDPARLDAARVVVVGVGALGQNVVQNLALSGVGHLLLVDFDTFEPHNATRSPFFPSPAEAQRYGLGKARVVAHRVAACATAAEPDVAYIDTPVQLAGDGPIRWADVVVAAVDSVSARAWLAERSRIHGRPMVEGGFAATEFNASVFDGSTGAVCYRCLNPSRVSFGSCRAYARMAEAASIIPAIQTSAAVLGGLMAEQTIQVIHGGTSWSGTRVYGDVRRAVMSRAVLPINPKCPGQHAVLPVLGSLPTVSATLGELIVWLQGELGSGWLMPAEPTIIMMACTRCTKMCRVQTTESVWLNNPRCADCGGPWPRTTEGGGAPQAVRLIAVEDEPAPLVSDTPTAALGWSAGGAVVVQDHAGRCGLLVFPGAGTAGAHRVGH
jgi:molybdopterin/thiamine biosynthesis adenylyltransferase